MKSTKHIEEALQVLKDLGMPRPQLNERSALCLLALLDLSPPKSWSQYTDPLIGITPIMEWVRKNYDKKWAPNTRETVRRQTMHQFVAAGIALYNPDDPRRPVNSPKAVYQVSPATLLLLEKCGTNGWSEALSVYIAQKGTLAAEYAKVREQNLVPVQISSESTITLSPGEHSDLIRAIIESFAPRFAPGSVLVYVGDTGSKWGYFDEDRLRGLGVQIDSHGKMPDVVLHFEEKNWLLLIESVTSHGPVNAKRHAELVDLFEDSTAGLVFVTAFPNRSVMNRYVGEIAWETEVWLADAPSHLVHFNGSRFLGPHG